MHLFYDTWYHSLIILFLSFISLHFSQAVEVPGVRIIQIAGGLNFANNDYLQHKILVLAEGKKHVKEQYDGPTSGSPNGLTQLSATKV